MVLEWLEWFWSGLGWFRMVWEWFGMVWDGLGVVLEWFGMVWDGLEWFGNGFGEYLERDFSFDPPLRKKAESGWGTQRAQCPLIEEGASNHNKNPFKKLETYALTKGYGAPRGARWEAEGASARPRRHRASWTPAPPQVET